MFRVLHGIHSDCVESVNVPSPLSRATKVSYTERNKGEGWGPRGGGRGVGWGLFSKEIHHLLQAMCASWDKKKTAQS